MDINKAKDYIRKTNKSGNSIVTCFDIVGKKFNIFLSPNNLGIFLKGFQCGELSRVKEYQEAVPKELPNIFVHYVIHNLKIVDSDISAFEFIKRVNQYVIEYAEFINAINDQRLVFYHYANILKEINEIESIEFKPVLYDLTDILRDMPEDSEYYSVSDKEFIKNLNIQKKSYSYEIWENEQWIGIKGKLTKDTIIPPHSDWFLCKDILKSVRFAEYEYPCQIDYLRNHHEG